jgi:hypothetical protein
MTDWTEWRLWHKQQAQQRELNALAGDEAVLQYDLAALTQRLVQLQRTVFELSVLNQVAMQMLAEAGHLDLDVLKYRVEARLDELTAPKVGPTPAAGSNTVACSRCTRVVPTSQTTLTGDGTLCDLCAPP